MYSLKDKEGTIINNVREDYFQDYDCRKLIGNIDFSVAIRQEGTYRMDEVEYMLWAEAKQGNKHPIYESFIQLILTIGKERTMDKNMPPKFLGAFDAEKIAFIPYSAVMEVFNQNDFNWNVTPSDHETKEFKQLERMVRAELNKTSRDADNIYVFEFGIDDKELRRFIRGSMVSGRDHILRMRINHNNFKAIYEKWRRDVMPTIHVNWDSVKRNGLIDADFYLADLIAGEDNITLLDKLHVLLDKTHYELDRQADTDGLFSSKQVQFRDNMLAHNIFWSKYTRPPKQEYWDRIIERRDLLVPQDIRERKGSYFTPPQWVELSQQYLADVLGENWQDEYYIWDCCAGTGNLLAGLTNKYNIYASTLDKADVRVMQERIEEMGDGSNLLPSHVFQFDFLNDSFDDPKLPQSLRNILTDPDKRRRLVIYINPPYAEAGNRRTVTGGGTPTTGVAVSQLTYKKYEEEIGLAGRELFVQFFIRVYHEIPSCTLAEFSKLKILQASNFADFRKIFQAKLERLFIVPAATFDNVKGQFPIGFFIWNTQDRAKSFEEIKADVYNTKGDFIGYKHINTEKDFHSINDWIIQTRKRPNAMQIAWLSARGCDMQVQSYNFITNDTSKIPHPRGSWITDKNIVEGAIYLAVYQCIEHTWLNDRDQFLYPNDGWKTDWAFQSDCLAYTLFHGQNRISHSDATPGTRTPSSAENKCINHWIPFTEQELDSPDCFQSHFMSDFLAGKIRPEQPQPAQTLFDDNACGDDVCGDDASRVVMSLTADEGVRVPGEAQQRETNNAQPYIPNAHFTPAAQAVMEAGRRLWYYYLHYPGSGNAPFGTVIDVNASFYDIRVFFQGRNDKGKMNNDSDDAEYMRLLRDLRQKQKVLAQQIAEKVYRYGFLK